MARNGLFGRFLNIIGISGAEEEYPNDGDYRPDRGASRTITPQTAKQPRARKTRDTEAPARREPLRSPVYNEEPQAPASRSRYTSYEDDGNERFQTGNDGRYRVEEPERPARREREEEPRALEPKRPRSDRGETLIVSIKDVRYIGPMIKALVRGNTIILTLETDDLNMRMRIIDTFSGAAFALNASIQRAGGSRNTYVIAPRTASVRSYNDYSNSNSDSDRED